MLRPPNNTKGKDHMTTMTKEQMIENCDAMLRHINSNLARETPQNLPIPVQHLWLVAPTLRSFMTAQADENRSMFYQSLREYARRHQSTLSYRQVASVLKDFLAHLRGGEHQPENVVLPPGEMWAAFERAREKGLIRR